jgi:hypothetical protein
VTRAAVEFYGPDRAKFLGEHGGKAAAGLSAAFDSIQPSAGAQPHIIHTAFAVSFVSSTLYAAACPDLVVPA